MSESKPLTARLRDLLGGWAFHLTCWLYQLPRDNTFLEVDAASNQPVSESPGDSGEAVELVARQLHAWRFGGAGWDGAAEVTKDNCRSHARIILAALAQPVPGDSGGVEEGRCQSVSGALKYRCGLPAGHDGDHRSADEAAEWWGADVPDEAAELLAKRHHELLRKALPSLPEWDELSEQDRDARFVAAREDLAAVRPLFAASTQPPSPQAEVQDCGEPQEYGFEIFKDAQDRFRWRLLSRRGLVLGTSDISHRTEQTAQRAIEDLQNAFTAPRAEPQGDVVEVAARTQFDLDGRDDAWANVSESMREEYRKDARKVLAAITPLLALEIRERLEGTAQAFEQEADEIEAEMNAETTPGHIDGFIRRRHFETLRACATALRATR